MRPPPTCPHPFPQIPGELKEAVARQVHLSRLGMKDLAEKVWGQHRPVYAPEPALIGKENEPQEKPSVTQAATAHPLTSKKVVRVLIGEVWRYLLA